LEELEESSRCSVFPCISKPSELKKILDAYYLKPELS